MRKANARRFLSSLLFGLLSLLAVCLSSAVPVSAAPDGGPMLMPQLQPDRDRMLRQLVPSRQGTLPPLVTQDSLRLAPYLEYCLDRADFADITEISSPQYQDRFQIFSPDRLPPAENGTFWLRFVLPASQTGAQPDRLLLDLGPSIPGSPVLYSPYITADGSVDWRESRPVSGRLLLPEAAVGVPLVCLLRMDGIPGFWFSPTVHRADTIPAADIDWRLIAFAAMATVFAMCLIKGLVEPGQWRLWALLYLAAAMAQVWGGPLPLQAGYTPRNLAAMTCAGLALMLWPHVGRHLLQSRRISRALDASLVLLCLPGAAAALLPLVPQFSWLGRYTELWPLAMVIFLPSALWACLRGAPNSVKFLLGTLVPPLGVAAGILGLRSGFPPELLAALPVFGLALGSLLTLSLVRSSARADDLDPHGVPEMANMVGLVPAPDKGGMNLNLSSDQEQPVELGEPLASGRDEAEKSLYGAYLAPLRKFEKDLAAADGPALPDSCRTTLDTLLDSARSLVRTLTELEEQNELDKRNAARMNVVIVSQDPAFCAVLTHVLRREDCHIRQTDSLAGALELGRRMPARLYIFQGAFADVESRDAIAALRPLAPAAGGSPVFLAYTADDSTWRALARAGFTHALVLPIDDSALLNTLKELREEEEQKPHGQESPAPRQTVQIPDLFGTGPMAEVSRPPHMSQQVINQRLAAAQKKAAARAPEAPAQAAAPHSQPAPAAPVVNLENPISPQPQPASVQREDLLGSPLSMNGQSARTDLLPDALRQELSIGLSQAGRALSSGDMPALKIQAEQLVVKTRDYPVLGRLAGLVARAAESGDRQAAREMMVELAEAVERRSRKHGI